MAEEGGRLEKRKSSCLSSDESDSERENGHSRSHSEPGAFTDCLWIRDNPTACGLEGALSMSAPKPFPFPSVTSDR